MASSLVRRAANYRAATVAVISALAIGLLIAGPASAAAPSNDSRLRPLILSPGTISGSSATSNAGATLEPGEKIPTCRTNVGASVWWRYRPPTDMIMTLSTAAGDPSAFSPDTVLAIYKSTPNGLQQAGCNDDYQSSQYSRFTGVVSGRTTYWIQITGFNNQQGSFVLNYAFSLNNDLFARAKPITPGFSDDFNTVFASTQSGEPQTGGCAGITNTVWYKFQPTVTQDVEFDTLGSSFDTVINVWQGTTLATLHAVTCSDDPVEQNGPSIASWHALQGATYYIQAGGFHAYGSMLVNFDRF